MALKLQRPGEILIHQGEKATVRFKIEEFTSNTRIVVTAATDITLKAFSTLNATSASITITGSVFTDSPSDQLEFTFAISDTASLAPQTYVYNITFTLSGGDTVKTPKDNLTVLRTMA